MRRKQQGESDGTPNINIYAKFLEEIWSFWSQIQKAFPSDKHELPVATLLSWMFFEIYKYGETYKKHSNKIVLQSDNYDGIISKSFIWSLSEIIWGVYCFYYAPLGFFSRFVFNHKQVCWVGQASDTFLKISIGVFIFPTWNKNFTLINYEQ